MLRRTVTRLSGDGQWHPRPHWTDLEPSSQCRGLLKAERYNGDGLIFRVLDPKWWTNRMTALGREGMMAAPILGFFIIQMFYGNLMRLTYYDGKPPRNVDWNAKKDGRLPVGFQKTVVKTA